MITITSQQTADITEIIEHIKDYLHAQPVKKYTLFNGAGGISLFLFNYFLFNKDDDKNERLAQEMLSFEGGRFSNDHDILDLYALQWFLWLIFHLQRNHLIDIDKKDFHHVKPLLIARFDTLSETGNYDLFYGAIGLGLTLKEFLPISQFCKMYEHFFRTHAKIDGTFFKWVFQIFDAANPSYNFGLAHGMPSIILSLCELYRLSGSKNKSVFEMICGCVNYMLSNSQPLNEIGSFFPNNISIDAAHRPEFSRLAWCYGDLGVGYAIYQAGITLHDQRFTDAGLTILQDAAGRRDPVKNLVKDLGICHGSSGLALFFKRLYEATNIEIFEQASKYWLLYTIEQIKAKENIDAVMAQKHVENNEYVFEEGMLTGIAGIGLVMLEFVSPKLTNWSECLML